MRHNEKPRLLFLPGMWEGAWIWASSESVANEHGWRTSANDLPSHGGRLAILNGRITSVYQYIDDVRRMVMNCGPVVLIGHSMGGLLAQAIAAEQHPEIKGVVLINTALPKFLHENTMAVLYRALKPRYLIAMAANLPLKLSDADTRTLLMNGLPDKTVQYYHDWFTPESGFVVKQLLHGSLFVDIGNIEAPVYFVTGTRDRIVNPAIQYNAARTFHAHDLILPGHGHMPILHPDWPITFNSILTWIIEHCR